VGVTVNMFNSNNLPINVNVNNGSSTFQIDAATGPNWTPATPATNPTFNPGPATAGNLGIGPNNVLLTPKGSTSTFNAVINLSGQVNWQSIQIYIFFQSYTSCSWIVLNSGQVVAQGVVLSDATLKVRPKVKKARRKSAGRK